MNSRRRTAILAGSAACAATLSACGAGGPDPLAAPAVSQPTVASTGAAVPVSPTAGPSSGMAQRTEASQRATSASSSGATAERPTATPTRGAGTAPTSTPTKAETPGRAPTQTPRPDRPKADRTPAPSRVDPTLTASPTTDISPGTSVTVTGSGYDTSKGIYVAYCVRPAPGAAPSPCGGGADMNGSSGSSFWISSNPPRYGKDLAQPFGAGGSFRVRLTIGPRIGDIDCREVDCVIASRADHTRSSDRSADVFVPVTFQE